MAGPLCLRECVMSCNSNVNIILKIQADKIQASFFELRSCDNQAGVFLAVQDSSIGDLVTHSLIF